MKTFETIGATIAVVGALGGCGDRPSELTIDTSGKVTRLLVEHQDITIFCSTGLGSPRLHVTSSPLMPYDFTTGIKGCDKKSVANIIQGSSQIPENRKGPLLEKINQ